MAQRMRREGVEQSPVDNECNMRATNKSGTQESLGMLRTDEAIIRRYMLTLFTVRPE